MSRFTEEGRRLKNSQAGRPIAILLGPSNVADNKQVGVAELPAGEMKGFQQQRSDKAEHQGITRNTGQRAGRRSIRKPAKELQVHTIGYGNDSIVGDAKFSHDIVAQRVGDGQDSIRRLKRLEFDALRERLEPGITVSSRLLRKRCIHFDQVGSTEPFGQPRTRGREERQPFENDIGLHGSATAFQRIVEPGVIENLPELARHNPCCLA